MAGWYSKYLLTTHYKGLPQWLSGKDSAMRELQETRVWSLGQEDPLRKGMAPHSSILAWRIPWTEEPGGLLSMGSHRVRHDWSDLAHTHARTHYRAWSIRTGTVSTDTVCVILFHLGDLPVHTLYCISIGWSFYRASLVAQTIFIIELNTL